MRRTYVDRAVFVRRLAVYTVGFVLVLSAAGVAATVALMLYWGDTFTPVPEGETILRLKATAHD